MAMNEFANGLGDTGLDDDLIMDAPVSDFADETFDDQRYTATEIAKTLAVLTSYGLPSEQVDGYQRDFAAATTGTYDLIEMGAALDKLGINKRSSAAQMPAWLVVTGALAFTGFTVYQLRSALQAPPVTVTEPTGEANGQNPDFDIGGDWFADEPTSSAS